MAPPNITTALAKEENAPKLASVMTAAFSSSDAAYPLIWGVAGDSVHDAVAVQGLFTPVQKEFRVTFKAMAGEKLVGFATWDLPKPDAPKRKDVTVGETKKSAGLPDIPGVNTALWNEKVNGPTEAYSRDVEPSEDLCSDPLVCVSERYAKG
ncbi:hypothetical protein D0Z07_8720 [Hyphodiscus hymeniophilus]|uniref:Uncharacterized protein n=1 Tax=Hyphodiscus hymeniophilus TaxID=353542 RepID=A0A9P6SL76_9HELO|nr:hypothetical protein D0Z07_8720 [Hyphodiscus hymeniophilus]